MPEFIKAMALLGLLTAATLIGASASILKANAHMAASGWSYPKACCDDRDCRQISGIRDDGTDWSEISQEGEYYVWRSSLTGRVHKVPAGDRRVRASGDQWWHGRESLGSTGYVLCLFQPVFM